MSILFSGFDCLVSCITDVATGHVCSTAGGVGTSVKCLLVTISYCPLQVLADIYISLVWTGYSLVLSHRAFFVPGLSHSSIRPYLMAKVAKSLNKYR